LNVLIVDDQPSARTMLRHVVEGIGQNILVSDFGNPVDALHWSESNTVDLVLLDYRMPEMDGLEFARRFRRALSRRDVPIVLISVVGDEPVRQAALDAGVIDFLVKPVRPRELRSRCKNLLQIRRQGETVKERARLLEQKVVEGAHEIEQRERELLQRLAKAIEYRDPGGAQHLRRVSRFAGMIAEAIGMPEGEIEALMLAAPLHDMGKIGIPDAILFKAEALNEEEAAIWRNHPLIGFEILRDSDSRFVQLAAQIALRHRERWDGSGYPGGLKGKQIPINARIVAVAEVFNRLTTDHASRPAWSNERALSYLNEHSGTLFDPACVDAMLANAVRIADIQLEHIALAVAGC
jgi:two-component system response regulator RpfG